jgi:hypothetical protein
MSPPEHEFHAHSTVAPALTVFADGLNALFVTEIPPADGTVFPGCCVGGAEADEPPPQAAAEISASVIHTLSGFMTLSNWN